MKQVDVVTQGRVADSDPDLVVGGPVAVVPVTGVGSEPGIDVRPAAPFLFQNT